MHAIAVALEGETSYTILNLFLELFFYKVQI
jgi:hypothetical protein